MKHFQFKLVSSKQNFIFSGEKMVNGLVKLKHKSFYIVIIGERIVKLEIEVIKAIF